MTYSELLHRLRALKDQPQGPLPTFDINELIEILDNVLWKLTMAERAKDE